MELLTRLEINPILLGFTQFYYVTYSSVRCNSAFHFHFKADLAQFKAVLGHRHTYLSASPFTIQLSHAEPQGISHTMPFFL